MLMWLAGTGKSFMVYLREISLKTKRIACGIATCFIEPSLLNHADFFITPKLTSLIVSMLTLTLVANLSSTCQSTDVEF